MSLSPLLGDLRFAGRIFRRSKAFYLAILLLLMGGIGATSAMCAIVRALVWTRLPYEQPEQLTMIWATREHQNRFKVSLPDFFDFQAQSRSFSHMAAMRDWLYLMRLPGEEPRSLRGVHVGGEYFETLKVPPLLGRLLTPEDNVANGPPVAVLSAAAWRRHFGADPSWVGRQVRLDSRDYRIVGVAGESLELKLPSVNISAEVWTPLAVSFPNYATTLAALRDDHETYVIARRKPGVSQAEAQRDLDQIAARIRAAHPEHMVGVRLVDLDTELRAGARESAWVLLLAVGLVFLVICSNVSSLLLSRAQARRGELATRAALGAAPSRLVRQLVTETTALFLLSIPGALLAARLCIRLFELFMSVGTAGTVTLTNLRVTDILVFSVVLCAVAGTLCGALPALSLLNQGLASAVKRSALGDALTRSQKRMQTGLVVAQISMAIGLLCGAGLAVQAFSRLVATPLGFRTHDTALAVVLASSGDPQDRASITSFYEELLRRLKRLPEVERVAATSSGPPLPFEAIQFEIRGENMGRRALLEEHSRVTPGYFDTLDIPILKGRDFTAADRADSPPVLIVSRLVEERYFGKQGALGRHVRLYGEEHDREVVGVVADVRADLAAQDLRAEGYLPFAQSPFQGMRLVLRLKHASSGDPFRKLPDIKQVVRSIDRNVLVAGSWWLGDIMGSYAFQRSATTMLLVAFSTAALLLSVVGVYGLASQLSLQRMREIGIRLALGTPPLSAAAVLLRAGMRVLALGALVGLVEAFIVGQLIARYVSKAENFDVWVFLGVPGLVILSGVAACALPAWRALRVSPASALRYE